LTSSRDRLLLYSADKHTTDAAIVATGLVKAKIFEQGFTSKGVGKGTGLGMAIAKLCQKNIVARSLANLN